MLFLVGRLPDKPCAYVVNTQNFEPELFTTLIPMQIPERVTDLTVTTLDLLGVLRRLGQESNIEFSAPTWITVNSLKVLAQNNMCELVYHIHGKDSVEYYNLTRTRNPYWSLELYMNPVRDRYFIEPCIYWDDEYKDPPHREIYARPINDAQNQLLKYPLDKIWYTESKWTEEENREWLSKCAERREEATAWLRNGVVINDGTKPLEF